ncbi:23798_t:CDS:2 [Gigaspora rosea]|nr:23798_t:CDS:2 [Gigaspora rosea]
MKERIRHLFLKRVEVFSQEKVLEKEAKKNYADSDMESDLESDDVEINEKLKDDDSGADSKDYKLYVNGIKIRTSIKTWRQSTKYVNEVNKQDLLYYNIINTVEALATKAQVIFKDEWNEMINTIESTINPKELLNEEYRNMKKHIKEFMSEIKTF